MISILWYVLANVAMYFFVRSTGDHESYVVIKVICFAISVIWLATILTNIVEEIKKQIKGIHNIDLIKTKKQTYINELESYKSEMQSELLEKYRTFEETIMKSISDSKLLASVMKDTNYSSMLSRYENRIKSFLEDIDGCDREMAEVIAELKTRQENIYSSGIFISKKYHYKGIMV